jgi:hypothetical protein
MTAQFKVDEVAVFQNARFLFEKEGADVLVVAPLDMYQFLDRPTNLRVRETGYLVLFPDGEEIFARPHQLRKKRPPQQYSGELRIRELFDQSPVEQLVPAEIA